MSLFFLLACSSDPPRHVVTMHGVRFELRRSAPSSSIATSSARPT